jgi:hypothetical protein
MAIAFWGCTVPQPKFDFFDGFDNRLGISIFPTGFRVYDDRIHFPRRSIIEAVNPPAIPSATPNVRAVLSVLVQIKALAAMNAAATVSEDVFLDFRKGFF